ncbi:MAG: GNAT family N-acetyltransferase [Pseudomonadota bacterium]
MGIAIRIAEDEDAEQIAALANLVGERVSDGAGAMTPELVRRDVLSPDTDLRALVAELDGRVAGMALHLFAYETAFAQRGRYLQDIAVHPWARRKGVARALIARLAALTRDQGGTFLQWNNMDSMHEGRALYRRICDEEAKVVAFAVTRERFQALADDGEA